MERQISTFEIEDEYDNPLRKSDAASPQNAGPSDPGASFDTETPKADPKADPKNVDDWGNLSLSAVRTGEVDELIVNYCKNACASTWLDASILLAIMLNTALLAMAGPATTLSEEAINK